MHHIFLINWCFIHTEVSPQCYLVAGDSWVFAPLNPQYSDNRHQLELIFLGKELNKDYANSII